MDMTVEEKLDRLESLVDRLSEDQEVEEKELRDIASNLETGTKYTCASCAMYCTGENIMVIYDTENDEFIQIEAPMDESEPVSVIRVS
jgi:Pyruvate/2-oxoacid:ferredoxin oxidoreductase delta subunit